MGWNLRFHPQTFFLEYLLHDAMLTAPSLLHVAKLNALPHLHATPMDAVSLLCIAPGRAELVPAPHARPCWWAAQGIAQHWGRIAHCVVLEGWHLMPFLELEWWRLMPFIAQQCLRAVAARAGVPSHGDLTIPFNALSHHAHPDAHLRDEPLISKNLTEDLIALIQYRVEYLLLTLG
ncbi:hypothetical protein HAX54_034850, partial [Datura stramonium]|nr:hypothetical protein [Datura stramonium]